MSERMARAPEGAADAAQGALEALVSARRACIAPMAAACFVAYIGTTALAGFAREFVAVKVAGSLNVGYVLIAANYVLAWALAIAYVRVANERFDPLAALAVAAARRAAAR